MDRTFKQKIIIAGAQGTGKSTLLKALEETFAQKKSDVILIKEVVRDLVTRKGVSINRSGDHNSQMLISEAHYFNALNYEGFISDRGAYDAFVYATYNYLEGKFTYNEHKQHREIFLATIPFYTSVFYLPVEFAVVDDGFRDIDENYRTKIDKLYKTIFKCYNISPILLTGSISQRLNAILDVIKVG